MEAICTCNYASGIAGHALNCPLANRVSWSQNITATAAPPQYQQTATGWTHKPVVNRLHPDDLAELTEKVAERVVQMLRAKVL